MTYTIYELLCFFVIYSVLGWCLEVCFCTINTGQFVNRGFLNGPVCPIYGFGMVIVLVALFTLPVRVRIIDGLLRSGCGD